MSKLGAEADAGELQTDRGAPEPASSPRHDEQEQHANGRKAIAATSGQTEDSSGSAKDARMKPPAAWTMLSRSAHPQITSSRSIYSYERLNHIQEGAYGVVFRARPRDSPGSSSVAVKKLKLDRTSVDTDGFPITSLREIQALTMARHNPHVVRLHEVCIGKTLDQIFLVMEFVEHDLRTLLTSFHRARMSFAPSEVKTLLHQLLTATAQLHDDFIVHRDLKTSNLLMNNRGILKVADFGLARRYTDPIAGWTAPTYPRSTTPVQQSDELLGGMTDLVVTLWYRAPELLLLNQLVETQEREVKQATKSIRERAEQPPLYDEKIDMWSIGCIFAELLLLAHRGTGLFQGKDEADQLHRIAGVLGPPNTTIWPELALYSRAPARAAAPHATPTSEEIRIKRRLEAEIHPTKLTPATLDLLFRLLHYDPKQRIGASEAKDHPYFTHEPPRMAHPDSFGSFPSVAAGERVPHETPSAPNEHAIRNGKRKLEASHAAGEAYPLQFDFDV